MSDIEQKVKETPYCSIGDNPLLVVVEISDQFNVKIDYQWGTNIRFFFIQKFSNNTKVIVIKWSMIPIWLKNSSKFNFTPLEIIYSNNSLLSAPVE